MLFVFICRKRRIGGHGGRKTAVHRLYESIGRFGRDVDVVDLFVHTANVRLSCVGRALNHCDRAYDVLRRYFQVPKLYGRCANLVRARKFDLHLKNRINSP